MTGRPSADDYNRDRIPDRDGEGPLRPRVGDQGAPGHRPGARQVRDRGAGHPAVGTTSRQRAGRQGDRQRRRQRAEQRGTRSLDAGGRHRLRRRRPDRQAHPAARPGACVPNPQAHQPHHGDRGEQSGPRGAACRTVGQHRARASCAGQQGRRREEDARHEGDRREGSANEGSGEPQGGDKAQPRSSAEKGTGQEGRAEAPAKKASDEAKEGSE